MKKPDSADCARCTLSDERFAPTYTPSSPQLPVLFVGEAAGEVEAVTGIPFSGPAGKTHYGMLRGAGLDKSRLAHTNVCLCFPRLVLPDGRVTFRKPTAQEQSCCRGRLIEDVRRIKPRLIVALGDVAMRALTGITGSVVANNGTVTPLRGEFGHKCPVLVALHPSFVMRQRQWIPHQVEVYRRVEKILSGRDVRQADPIMLLDPSAEELEAYLAQTDGPVACDLETTGLDVLTDHVIGASFAVDTESAAAVIFTGPDDPRLAVARRVIESDRPKVWQNGAYDTAILRHSSAPPSPILDRGFAYDTRLAEQLLNSDMPADLDSLRSRYTGIQPYKPPKTQRARIASWTKADILRYAALDAVTTFSVYAEQLKKMTPSDIGLMERLLIPLAYVTGKMRARGIAVDARAVSSLQAEMRPKLEALEKRFHEMGVNPRSPSAVCRFFGLRKSDRETLQRHIDRGERAEELQLLLDFRNLDKQMSVYLDGIVNRVRNGRVHPEYRVDGTGTGRLSSTNPNIQNVMPSMRRIYVADKGCWFVRADYSQIELWVGAIVAGEDRMLDDLRSGVDIHYIACQLCYPKVPLKTGTRSGDFTKQQIRTAKTVVFGTFYGLSPRTLSIRFKVPVSTAVEWQNALLNHYPGLRRYTERIEREVRERGFLSTPFGRRRTVTSVTQGLNFPVQSTAADVALTALVEADRAGLTPVITVHDEIVFSVPKRRYKEDLAKIKRVIERPFPELGGHSFRAEYSYADNWGEL